MKLLPIALLPTLLSACVVNIHVHEAPKPPPAAAASAPSGSVSGIVVDVDGKPVRAHVAAVGEGGSYSMGTDETGRFQLDRLPGPGFVLHASTDDDRVAVRSGVRAGDDHVELVARPGSTVTLVMKASGNLRCAVFQGDVRVEDFTLRPSKPEWVVVPPGETRFRLYEGHEVRAERTVHVEAGKPAEIEFQVGA